MNKQELDALSPEGKRQKIAEACGWRKEDWPDPPFPHPSVVWWPPDSGQWNEESPDYLNNLNAMREAYLTLSDAKAHLFIAHLSATVGEKGAVNATAAQRADAFLLTVG